MPAKKAAAKASEIKEAKGKDVPQKSALELLMASEKKHARHIELRATQADDFLSTGILSFDLILGGGYFSGRILQIFGRPGAGKSTLGYTSTGCLTRQKVVTGMLDYEGTTTKDYRERLARIGGGKENPYFRYYRPQHGPEGYAMIQETLQALPDQDSGPPSICFLVDTIATMPTQGEMEDWSKNKRMAQRATMHSEWMGRIKLLVAKKNATIIAINQVRADPSPYGSMVRPGGNAWEFATDNLIMVKGGKAEEVDGDVYQPMSFKTFKNKNYQSMQEAEVYLRLGHGVDPASDVIEFLRLTGLYRMVQVKKTKVPVITGLDEFAKGAKLDGQYRNVKQLTELIREQHGNEEQFIVACRNFLSTGKAVKAWEAEKVRKAKNKEGDEEGLITPKPDTKDDLVGAEEFGTSSVTAAQEDSAPEAEAPAAEQTPEQTAAAAEEEQKAVAKLKKKRNK